MTTDKDVASTLLRNRMRYETIHLQDRRQILNLLIKIHQKEATYQAHTLNNIKMGAKHSAEAKSLNDILNKLNLQFINYFILLYHIIYSL